MAPQTTMHSPSSINATIMPWKAMSSKAKTAFVALTLCLAALLSFAVVPAQQAFAEENERVSFCGYDFTDQVVTYGSVGKYTVVDDSTTTWSGNEDFYVVNKDVTINERINVKGTVYLILTDGATLTASKGISVEELNTLYVYAQEEGTGTLTATSTDGAAAIGSKNSKAGSIIIAGGIVTATASSEKNAGTGGAGIGGGHAQSGGYVAIAGGTVTATSETDGAGIGGGFVGWMRGNTTNAGIVEVYAGK